MWKDPISQRTWIFICGTSETSTEWDFATQQALFLIDFEGITEGWGEVLIYRDEQDKESTNCCWTTITIDRAELSTCGSHFLTHTRQKIEELYCNHNGVPHLFLVVSNLAVREKKTVGWVTENKKCEFCTNF